VTYTIRQATSEDVRPALVFTLSVFMRFDAMYYEPQAIDSFKDDIARTMNDETYLKDIINGKSLLFIALDGDKIIGVIGNMVKENEISALFVDGDYHRQGIATALMNRMVCELKLRGFDYITVDASPYGLPFYIDFGFTPTDFEKRQNGFVFTPLAYRPNEIWDVYDCDRNKTGRYAERGRPMATGDYHIVVHVWKRNRKGEWLIDKRADRGSDIDGFWETTGGAAIAGDDSMTAALRETKEELGICLAPQNGVLFCSTAHERGGHTWFEDVWVFDCDVQIEEITLQKGETCDAMWASADKIKEMMAAGEFLGNRMYPYFDDMIEKWKISK